MTIPDDVTDAEIIAQLRRAKSAPMLWEAFVDVAIEALEARRSPVPPAPASSSEEDA